MPVISGGGGGGSYTPPTAREQISGNNVAIADAASASLTWDSSLGPDSLLNLAAPALPTIITAGVYAVSVSVGPSANMTAAGGYTVILDLDRANEDAQMLVTSSPSTATEPTPLVSVACTYYLATGAQLRCLVINHDGAASRNF